MNNGKLTLTNTACILMATYNGKTYIAEQIASIQMQTYLHWVLLISDDGSNDGTIDLIKHLAEKDKRILLLDNSSQPVRNPCGNFARLIAYALTTPYEFFFFCDQDDDWQSEKIAKQMQRLINSNKTEPYLCHHDLTVVDAELKVMSESFFKHMRLTPEEASFYSLLGRNEVTGCTIACNRKLLEIASPISEKAIMHDWWLALICALFGQIDVLDEKLVNYRQHGRNSIGAKHFWSGLNPFTNWKKGWERGNNEFLDTIKQTNALREHINHSQHQYDISEDILLAMNEYCDIIQKNPTARVATARKFGLLKSHWLLRCINIVRLLTIDRSILR